MKLFACCVDDRATGVRLPEALLLVSSLALSTRHAFAQTQPDWATRLLRARSGHAMAYDVARQRVVVFGGTEGSVLVSYLSEVLFGGVDFSGGIDSDTWLYGGLTLATTQPFGTACSGAASPPILASNVPWLGNPAFALDLIGARASSACLFGLSATATPLPIPPCTLHVFPLVLLAAVSNQAGFAATPASALPLDTSLRGGLLFAQAFVVDPQGPVLGLTFSAGLRLVLGD